MEIFKSVKGYNGLYAVSNLGRVKSIQRTIVRFDGTKTTIPGRMLKSLPRPNGYKYVVLCQNNIKLSFSIARLVAISFLPNPLKKPCVNHINGDKTDNRLENLEWSTYSENTKHAYDNGLAKNPVGEKCSYSKLTETQVLEIRQLAKDGVVQPEIAKLFRVSRTCISAIITNRNWRHV